jgi:hypothetical protein
MQGKTEKILAQYRPSAGKAGKRPTREVLPALHPQGRRLCFGGDRTVLVLSHPSVG